VVCGWSAVRGGIVPAVSTQEPLRPVFHAARRIVPHARSRSVANKITASGLAPPRARLSRPRARTAHVERDFDWSAGYVSALLTWESDDDGVVSGA
jgi:hypothetical protein